jgi:mycothiol synthase
MAGWGRGTAIERADAKAWAELLAAVELADHTGENYDRAKVTHVERRPEAPGEIGTDAISTNSSALKLFAACGFEACRYFFHMERDLGAELVPASAVPDGLRLVEFDPTYDEALRLTHNETFLDHWGSTPKDPESWKTWFTGSRAFRAAQSYLVLDGERIVAYVLGYEYVADTAATGTRELYVGQVGTRRDYRGRGAARAALARVMTVAEDAGFRRVSLGVDADNPTGALGLYEKLEYLGWAQSAEAGSTASARSTAAGSAATAG